MIITDKSQMSTPATIPTTQSAPSKHACEMSAACTTCHCIIRKGFESLDDASDIEEDLLDKAWGLEQTSRLSCQAVPKDQDIEIEVPKYNINMVSEDH